MMNLRLSKQNTTATQASFSSSPHYSPGYLEFSTKLLIATNAPNIIELIEPNRIHFSCLQDSSGVSTDINQENYDSVV